MLTRVLKFCIAVVPVLAIALVVSHFAAPIDPALAQGGNPKVKALIQSLSRSERQDFMSLSGPERREFIQKLMQERRGGGSTPSAKSPPASTATPQVPTANIDTSLWRGPIIDVHSQVDQRTDLSSIVPMLDQAGVSVSLISTRFKQPSSDILNLAKQHPDRIIPTAKSKTKPFMKGFPTWRKYLNTELQRHPYRAMAEIIMWHAAKRGVGAGKAVIEPDDERVAAMVEAARKFKWPYIVHIEFAAMGWDKRDYMAKLEKLFKKNQDVQFGMIHLGQLEVPDVALLLPKHPNLFFITSHANPISKRHSGSPWSEMFSGDEFTSKWGKLLLQYPDRFVLAFDNVFAFHWEDAFLPQVELWRKALAKIPDGVAHAIAHKNAERLWRLEPAKPVGAYASTSGQ
ncbi:MAG: amidohydrolase family protein [Rhodospirillaceae bacterium]|jgi:predicted TIM-barrel fold metal-dependent hydrolase|nr:amidohydrolase family protein [Rhodospirillaceae bacterium]MBT5941783.1 amidohydrolase family protein [Rhodospirillaceae bacterium]